ncbi:hypothetical protein M404DRAFT_1002030 [Pisolithus tinctorius Marx 270]|uniref:Uncharacterized protein n=1 Tax=Pisolithus tinctorius Marx 270 TaxID=870435 RepID=A0A0C3JZH9_PISTI|nr:hypothetical protein M404DRAFT_1002030 [Pisolithus tinctorius Marx 270]
MHKLERHYHTLQLTLLASKKEGEESRHTVTSRRGEAEVATDPLVSKKRSGLQALHSGLAAFASGGNRQVPAPQ